MVALLVDGAGRPSGCRRGVCFYKIQIGRLLGHDQPQLGKENPESRHARPVRMPTESLNGVWGPGVGLSTATVACGKDVATLGSFAELDWKARV